VSGTVKKKNKLSRGESQVARHGSKKKPNPAKMWFTRGTHLEVNKSKKEIQLGGKITWETVKKKTDRSGTGTKRKRALRGGESNGKERFPRRSPTGGGIVSNREASARTKPEARGWVGETSAKKGNAPGGGVDQKTEPQDTGNKTRPKEGFSHPSTEGHPCIENTKRWWENTPLKTKKKRSSIRKKNGVRE